MEKKPSAALLEHFAILPDPRIERHRYHKLGDIVTVHGVDKPRKPAKNRRFNA